MECRNRNCGCGQCPACSPCMLPNPQSLFAVVCLFPLSGPTLVRADAFAGAQTAILERVKAPQFPQRDFPITDFGAVAEADCMEALAKAVTACHAAGGGR